MFHHLQEEKFPDGTPETDTSMYQIWPTRSVLLKRELKIIMVWLLNEYRHKIQVEGFGDCLLHYPMYPLCCSIHRKVINKICHVHTYFSGQNVPTEVNLNI